ncbi:ABC transporter substrate-binding protein (plasmid) [Pseudomonas silvicola]|nr:ABC transporter substrate-binding protein [Pseudomonas silvicola]
MPPILSTPLWDDSDRAAGKNRPGAGSEQRQTPSGEQEVGSVKELKGKQVAYEEGTTSDILLRSALASAGLSFSDIKPVPMPAASAGSAILAGRVPVAVTYEPYLSVAKKSDPKY